MDIFLVNEFKGMVDIVVSKAGIDTPASDPYPAEEPSPGVARMAAVRELGIEWADIRSYGPRASAASTP